MFQIFVVLSLLFSILELQAAEKKIYSLKDDPIDVIIPCYRGDLDTLELCIEGIKNNCVNLRRIVVVSEERLSNNAEWFDERNYPFTKNDIAISLFNDQPHTFFHRVGWYYQQLLKLYALYVIPDISSNLLVVDADTVFLRPVEFLNSSFGGQFTPGFEYNPFYFQHAAILTNNKVTRVYGQYSGIAHHMLFQKAIMDDLFSEVECLHQREFWRAFCICVDANQLFAGASEYELYFNYALSQTDQVEIRHLQWANITNLNLIPSYKDLGYHYTSCHLWSR